MNEPKFATGHKVRIRTVIDRGANPGKNPNVASKGKSGTVKGYGGWNNNLSAANGGNVDHEYVVKTEDGTVVVISESWLEPA